MFIYYVIFLISTLFVYIGENKRCGKIETLLIWGMAVFIPALMAGMRADTVGTDTSGYIKAIFRLCQNGADWKVVVGAYQCEIGYYWINWVVSFFSDSFQILLFILELLILVPVLIACKDNNDLVDPHISYLFFLIMFYNRSLNMCRQSIAISFCMLSVIYIRKQDIRKFILCIIPAILMHRISIVFIAVYFIFSLLKRRGKTIYKCILCVNTILMIVFYQTIVKKLVLAGYISSRYLYYTNGGEQNISTIEFVTKIIFLIVTILASSYLNKKNQDNNIILFFLIMDILIYSIGFYANYAQRISYYIGFFVVFIIPQIPKCMKKNQRILGMTLLLILALTFSYYYYGISGCDGTVPYKIANTI